MKKLCFDYFMRIAYAQEVGRCHFTIKCMPPDTDRQRVEQFQIEVLPSKKWTDGEDSFGNRLIYGRTDEAHQEFSYRILGTAFAGLADYESRETGNMLGVYRYPSGLTQPGEELRAYFERLSFYKNRDVSAYEQATELMHTLYRDFSYVKRATDVSTTAEEAWKGRKGVCQDYAHIMITLCRMAGIPARYVTGMLTGEGSSHAWTEVFSKGKWYGLDPTNDAAVTDSHIKLGNGRDAADCLVNKGLLVGGGMQAQTVCVKVTEEPCYDKNDSIRGAARG